MYVEVNPAMVDDMNNNMCGECVVSDEEAARKVLELFTAYQNNAPEPVLYDDEQSYCTNQVDEDILAQVIELQGRMDKGLEMIKDLEKTYVASYLEAKKAFNRAKEVVFGHYEGNVPQKWWDKFNQLKAERNGRYSLMMEKIPLRQKYWSHWKNLRDQCMELIGGDKAIWARYFQIEDKEEFLREYLSRDFNPVNDSSNIDNQEDLKLVSGDQMDVYRDTYLEEQQELFVYNY